MLLDRVVSLEFKFLGNEGWKDEWEEDYLPLGVEINIEIATEDAKSTRIFRTLVDLPCGGEKEA